MNKYVVNQSLYTDDGYLLLYWVLWAVQFHTFYWPMF